MKNYADIIRKNELGIHVLLKKHVQDSLLNKKTNDFQSICVN